MIGIHQQFEPSMSDEFRQELRELMADIIVMPQEVARPAYRQLMAAHQSIPWRLSGGLPQLEIEVKMDVFKWARSQWYNYWRRHDGGQ